MKKKMRNRKRTTSDKFWEDMAKRPYPYNRPSAITAQALSPFSGLSEKDKMEFTQNGK